jgi:probable HAF family extracellular repeat protein
MDPGSLGGSASTAFAISSSGQAAGWGLDPLGNTEAVVFGGANPTNLLAGSSWSGGQATGINSSGQVSGTVWNNGTSHGVIWSGGSSVDLGANTSAAAINDAGQVAGSSNQAFLYQNGAVTNLGTLSGGDWTLAEGLSGNGGVAGYGDSASGTRGFVWTSGAGMLELGTLGGNSSYGMAVDDAGEVAGSAATGSGYLNATSWSSGTATDLGTLGGNNSYAYGINDAGVIVGYSSIYGNETTHAFVVLNGVMVDLNSLLAPADSEWTITAAYGINDQNQIVGAASYNGQSYAVLLNDPPLQPAYNGSAAPEPATWFLAGGALLFGGAFRKRFSRSH